MVASLDDTLKSTCHTTVVPTCSGRSAKRRECANVEPFRATNARVELDTKSTGAVGWTTEVSTPAKAGIRLPLRATQPADCKRTSIVHMGCPASTGRNVTMRRVGGDPSATWSSKPGIVGRLVTT